MVKRTHELSVGKVSITESEFLSVFGASALSQPASSSQLRGDPSLITAASPCFFRNISRSRLVPSIRCQIEPGQQHADEPARRIIMAEGKELEPTLKRTLSVWWLLVF
jgi:hypothetical protein